MTQAEKDKIIAELQEKLAEAEKIKVDEAKRWKPNKGEVYALVNIGHLGAIKEIGEDNFKKYVLGVK